MAATPLRRRDGSLARWLPRALHRPASKGVPNGLSSCHPPNLADRRGGAGGRDQRASGVGADQYHGDAAGAKDAGEAGRAGGSRSWCFGRRLQPQDVGASGNEASEAGRAGGSRFGPGTLIGEGVPRGEIDV